MRPIQANELVGKIYVSQRHPDRRHDDVFDQRGHNFSECCADDYAHRKINHIPAHRKSFKFLEHIYFLSRAISGVTPLCSAITWSGEVAPQRSVTIARFRLCLAPSAPPRHTLAAAPPTQTAPAKSLAARYP